ncbi:RRQRL motif-containing zinc-binding protein [Actinomadura roseirufa]|uniref:RRQRL motif-containing zinc-binding protein n=1 Tax=Actinomadura roseirufa TaxID=2094049 RepID=UPI001040FA6B|nr:RRQRL motif-containing zinc-binding protein [Actinomadura roseirufa]
MPKTLSIDRFMDPTGTRYGIPTWPWRMAPAHLLTRRQLTARGLRPGGQPVCGQILWASRRRPHVRAAYLYDVRFALPKRTATPRQLGALDKAMAARRTCPRCGEDAGYVLPTRYGACLDCLTDWEIHAA